MDRIAMLLFAVSAVFLLTRLRWFAPLPAAAGILAGLACGLALDVLLLPLLALTCLALFGCLRKGGGE